MFFYGIQLRENQNYELKKTYLEVNKPMEEFTGKFSWTNDDSAVDLERAELFQVQEFRLMKEIIYLSGGSPSEKYYFPQVDVGPLDGEISSELVGDWGVYKRIGEDGKWTDKTFSTLSFTKTGKIRGESACNAYYGTFSVPASQRLYLSPISSTKMACPNLSAEQEFLDALNKATYYYKFGEQLILISEDLKPLIWAMGIVK
jgi:heat shock protein HslJ